MDGAECGAGCCACSARRRRAVPDAARAPLEGAVLSAVGAGLTRRSDGTTAIVLSGGNAGRATERGVEVATQWRPAPGWHVDANYTLYRFSLVRGSFLPGDSVLANTPANSGNTSVTYTRTTGAHARIGVRVSEAFDWRSALWSGRVPAHASVDVVLSHPFTAELSASVVGTNMLDQQRYQFFGGSLVRRRVVASLTWRR
jgi:outer membrane receptor protein involved in Fe transport